MARSEGRTRVLMISFGYVPFKTPSDKQFVHELIGAIDNNIDIAIWSINDAEKTQQDFQAGSRTFHYRNANRLFHRPLFGNSAGAYRPHPTHSDMRNGIEINMSLLLQIPKLVKFMHDFKPDIVHFTDSPGPVGRLLKMVAPRVPFTIVKPTMRAIHGEINGLYPHYVRASLSFAQKIVTFTTASKTQLAKLGIPPRSVDVISWGVLSPKSHASENKQSAIRKRYQVGSDELLVVVTDRMFGEHIVAMIEDLKSMKNAQRIRFVVAIRPTRFTAALGELSNDRVWVENGPSDFHDLLDTADALLSPPSPHGHGSTSLIPLTWLEAMVRSTLVITGAAPGVEDVVKQGETGFLFNNFDGLRSIFAQLHDPDLLSQCNETARLLVEKEFTMRSIATKYQSLWEKLAMRS